MSSLLDRWCCRLPRVAASWGGARELPRAGGGSNECDDVGGEGDASQTRAVGMDDVGLLPPEDAPGNGCIDFFGSLGPRSLAVVRDDNIVSRIGFFGRSSPAAPAALPAATGAAGRMASAGTGEGSRLWLDAATVEVVESADAVEEAPPPAGEDLWSAEG
jgi:hypothetical protein